MTESQKPQRLGSLSPLAEEIRERPSDAPDPTAPNSVSARARIAHRERPLFGIPTKTLELRVRPGYVARWINDSPGRVDRAKQCGYEHIKGDDDQPIKRVVNKKTGLQAFAMEIPKQFYDADFALKQQRDDEIAAAIMREPLPDAGYRPAHGQSSAPQSEQRVTRGGVPA